MYLKLSLFVSFLTIATNLFAQSKEFEDVLKVKLRNTAVIQNNQVVVGYAFLYVIKSSKKSATYRMQILDENLKTIGNTEFVGGPDVVLTSALYESDHLMFAFNDYKIPVNAYNKVRLTQYVRVYDLNGNKTGEVYFEPAAGNKGLLGEEMAEANAEDTNGFENVPGLGFISVYQNQLRSGGTKLQMISETGKLKWEKLLTAQKGLVMDSYLLGTTSRTIFMFEGLRKNVLSFDEDIFLVGLDAATGEQRFRKPLSKGNYVYEPQYFKPSNESKMYMTSIITDVNSRFLNAKPLGFSVAILDDLTGDIEALKDFIYEQDLNSVMNMTGTKSDQGYLQVNDIVFLKDRSKIVIGEFFNITKGTIGMSNATLGDAFMLRISPDDKVVALDKISQLPARKKTLGYGSIGAIQKYMKSQGYFGYRYTDQDANADRVSVIIYGQFEGKEKGLNTITFTGEPGYKTKTFPIKEKQGEDIAVFRAKPGHVLVSKYNAKEKKISLNLERVD